MISTVLLVKYTPPNISTSVIRNLGATFCNLDPDQLSDIALAKKRKVTTPVGKKKTIKKPSKNPDDDNDDKANKKKKERK